mmetsp:Transcript_70525/g.206876  ORF Transcript_70525/g.206876 Transcript_70525/m.206876 type:complete len:200 (+) Transcript_70525:3-602(+)
MIWTEPAPPARGRPRVTDTASEGSRAGEPDQRHGEDRDAKHQDGRLCPLVLPHGRLVGLAILLHKAGLLSRERRRIEDLAVVRGEAHLPGGPQRRRRGFAEGEDLPLRHLEVPEALVLLLDRLKPRRGPAREPLRLQIPELLPLCQPRFARLEGPAGLPPDVAAQAGNRQQCSHWLPQEDPVRRDVVHALRQGGSVQLA